MNRMSEQSERMEKILGLLVAGGEVQMTTTTVWLHSRNTGQLSDARVIEFRVRKDNGRWPTKPDARLMASQDYRGLPDESVALFGSLHALMAHTQEMSVQ